MGAMLLHIAKSFRRPSRTNIYACPQSTSSRMDIDLPSLMQLRKTGKENEAFLNGGLAELSAAKRVALSVASRAERSLSLCCEKFH